MATKNTATKKERQDIDVKKYLFFIFKFLLVFLISSWFFNLRLINDFFIKFFILISRGFLFLIGKGNTTIINNQILVNNIPLVMIGECTGIAMYSLFIAFAVAYECDIKKKMKYLAIGLALLVGLNMLRLFTIISSAFINAKLLDFIHDFLWPSTFFIFTLIAILYFIKRCSK